MEKGVTNKVFANYTKLPERLCELALIEIPDPAEAIAEIMKELKAETVVGKKRSAALTASLIGEYPSGTPCSGYDLAMSFLELPSRCVFPGADDKEDAQVKQGMEAMVYKAPFLNFNKFISEDDAVVVLPA